MHHGNRIVWIASIGIWLLPLLSAGTALADGCYFPEKAIQKMPAIPRQRAVLVYKDQTERLIIESSLDAEGQRFGWIIPVPARPTSVEETSSGLLSTLSISAEPEITHDVLGGILPLVGPLVLIMTLWAISVLLEGPDKWMQRGRQLTRWLIGLTFWLSVANVLFPHLGKSSPGGATRADRVCVEASQIVGNYEVSVLQADSADALSSWLSENGFAPLPEAGHAIVADYIQDKWHFVAAKLQREGAGLARPHPLSIAFPARQVIYPMRLTSLADSPVALELFVVSDQRARTDGLSVEFSDVFRSKPKDPRNTAPPGYASSLGRSEIAHPKIDTVLWDGCCLTKLAGTISPKNMARDIDLQWQMPSPYRQHVYSYRGAHETAVLWAVLLWGVGLPVGMVIVRRRAPEDPSQRRLFHLAWAFRPVSISCALLYVGLYLALPKVETEAIGFARKFGHPIGYQDICGLALESGGSIAEFRHSLTEHLRYAIVTNLYTYGRMEEEDSPGNYSIERAKDTFVITEYGDDMSTWTWSVPCDDRRSGWPHGFSVGTYELQREEARQDVQRFLDAPSKKTWDSLVMPCSRPEQGFMPRCMAIIRMGRKDPQRVVPLLVQDIRQRLRDKNERAWGKQLTACMGMLGYIIRVSPPLDFDRQPDAEAFLRAAEDSLRHTPGEQHAAPVAATAE